LKRIGLIAFVFMMLPSAKYVYADTLPIPATPYNIIQHVEALNNPQKQWILKRREERQLERAYAITSPRRWREYQIKEYTDPNHHFVRLYIKDVGEFKRASDDLDLTQFKRQEVYFGHHNVHIPKSVKVIVEPYITWIKVKDAPQRGTFTRLKEDGYLWLWKHWNDIRYPEH